MTTLEKLTKRVNFCNKEITKNYGIYYALKVELKDSEEPVWATYEGYINTLDNSCFMNSKEEVKTRIKHIKEMCGDNIDKIVILPYKKYEVYSPSDIKLNLEDFQLNETVE